MHTERYCTSDPQGFFVIAGSRTREANVSSHPDASSVEWSLCGMGLAVGAARPNSRVGEIHSEWSLHSCSRSSASTCAQ